MKDFKKLSEMMERLRTCLMPGRVLSPLEVAEECKTLKGEPPVNTYVLSASLSDAVVKQFESEIVPQGLRFTVIPSTNRLMVGVATIQAGGLQVRFVVPFSDEKSIQWIDHSIAKSQLTFALDVVEKKQVVFVGASATFAEADALRHLVRSSATLDNFDVFGELGEVVGELLVPERIPSCLPHFAVNDVKLVLASELLYKPLPVALEPGVSTMLH